MPERTPRAGAAVLVALCCAAFAGYLNSVALTPLLPAISADLGASVSLLGQVPALTLVLAAGLGLVIGPLADHFGHRRVLLLGTLAIVGAGLTTALANSFTILLLAAAFGAASRAVALPVPYAIAGARFPPAMTRRAIGRIIATAAASLIIGAPLLTTIAASAGWRASFVFVALLGLVAIAVILRLLPADTRTVHTRFDLAGVLGTYGPLVRSRGMLGIYGCSLSRATGLWLVLTYMGAFLVQRHGLTSPEVGLAFAGVGVGELVGSLIAGERLGRIPLRPLLAGAQVLIGLLLGAALLLPLGALAVAILFMLATVVNGVTDVAEPSLLAAETPSGHATTMTFEGVTMSAGSGIGSSLGGVLLALSGYPAMGAGVILFCLIAALLVWQIRPRVAAATEALPNLAG
jgi:predicted MFS family arabinose efflux permease